MAGSQEVQPRFAGSGCPVRERLVAVCACLAFDGGYSPQDVAKFLVDGFPDKLLRGLDRPGEQDELRAYADLILRMLEPPARTRRRLFGRPRRDAGRSRVRRVP